MRAKNSCSTMFVLRLTLIEIPTAMVCCKCSMSFKTLIDSQHLKFKVTRLFTSSFQLFWLACRV